MDIPIALKATRDHVRHLRGPGRQRVRRLVPALHRSERRPAGAHDDAQLSAWVEHLLRGPGGRHLQDARGLLRRKPATARSRGARNHCRRSPVPGGGGGGEGGGKGGGGEGEGGGRGGGFAVVARFPSSVALCSPSLESLGRRHARDDQCGDGGRARCEEIRNAWHRFEQEAGREFHLEWKDDIAVPAEYAMGDSSDRRYDLIRFVREQRSRLPHGPRLILVTSIPFSDPELATDPEGFDYSADALSDHSVAIIAPMPGPGSFRQGARSSGSKGTSWRRSLGCCCGKRPAFDFTQRLAAASLTPIRSTQDISRFQGELCAECRMEMECRELGQTITIPQLALCTASFAVPSGARRAFSRCRSRRHSTA